MGKEKIPVYRQTGDAIPWTDKTNQSVEEQEIPVHGQREVTGEWADRKY